MNAEEIIHQMTHREPKTDHCDIHGEFESRPMFFREWSPCPICRAETDAKIKMEQKAKQEADEKRKKQNRFLSLLNSSELPLRFHDRTLVSYIAETAKQKEALDFANEYAEQFQTVYETGRCALFSGRPGTGKTHLAAGIALHLMNQNYSVKYTTVNRLIRRIRGTWSRDSEETENQAIAVFTRPDLLILDEVGVQHGSESEKNTLFEVINSRYENRMPTLFISNLDKKGVAESLGERISDRFREDGGKVIAFAWESQRPNITANSAPLLEG